MRTHTSAAVNREELIAKYRAARDRTRALFEIPIPDAYYDRPIALRNPIVFYEGHLPVFSVNTLVKLARQKKGLDARFESLFERGIDPEDETAVRDPAEAWPSRREVQAYGRATDELIEDSLRNLNDDPLQIEAAHAVVEHELMHQETFAYMLHTMPFERKRHSERSEESGREAARAACHLPPGFLADARNDIHIPAGIATLGADGSSFAWDNELPMHEVRVAAFEIDRVNVTNGEYLEFMHATGGGAPHFWAKQDGEWLWRSMFELKALPLDAPVWVTHEQASRYAQWKNARLMTEAEYHRAAHGASEGNIDFATWDPMPVGSHPAAASTWGVHDLIGDGWEWTATVFAPFAGFKPMATYERYSADFFDGQHFVLKGGSPATGRELVRRSFRNWFRPNYPYVYAKFRCVR